MEIYGVTRGRSWGEDLQKVFHMAHVEEAVGRTAFREREGSRDGRCGMGKKRMMRFEGYDHFV